VKFWMKVAFVGVSISMVTITLSQAQMEQALSEARHISDELVEKVRGLLFQEIEKGGFPRAVQVCSESAQEIARPFNVQPDHHVRRVSLRYRNPKNAPDSYERKKLEEFDLLNREKKLANEYVEVLREKGREYLRYMRPLLAAPVCINCHGPKENISLEVKAILAEKYPDDQATGFLVGDVRGAISVKIALPAKK